MSTSPDKPALGTFGAGPSGPGSRPAAARRKPLRPWIVASVAVLLVGGAALTVYAVWFRGAQGETNHLTTEVKRGPLVISVAETGTLQNRERVVIKSEVEGSNSILYLIPEGTMAVGGQTLLVQLDSSKMTDARDQQQIVVMNAEAAFIRARETLEVVKSQTASDVAQADLKHKFAQQDLDKYQKGDFPRALQKAEADIKIADEELQRATIKLDWSKRLSNEGYVTRTELQADDLAAKRAEINLGLARTDLELLKVYTFQRNLDQLNSDVQQSREELERAKRKATADVVQAEADLKAKQSEFERQQAKLKKSEEQIAKCRIVAPKDGMVVYASTGDSMPWRSAEPLAEGSTVRERQDLIYLPSSTSMKADARIREASLRKVRLGMPVRVTVEAVPGQQFWGTVGRIGVLPDAQMSRFTPDVKFYSMEVHLEGDTGGLRAGMNCQVQIIVEQFADALYVPVQSVVRQGGQAVVYVLDAAGRPQVRPVEIGLDNNLMVRVIDGLSQGERVLLAPPLTGGGTAAGPADSLPTTRPFTANGNGPVPGNGGLAATQPGPGGRDPRTMTPEERRQYFGNLTPEQREELRRRFPGRGTRSGGGGSGGGPEAAPVAP